VVDENRIKSNFIEYMLTLEILSTNRNLKDKLKKVEDMLRDIRYEDLPSYEIAISIFMQRVREQR